jgi:multisubunit Na+/H+ antiporter MnhB subunit
MQKKKYLPFVLIGIASVLIQIFLVYRFEPSAADFAVKRTITGTYTVSGGQARTRATTAVNGYPVFCSISYLGPADSCLSQYGGHAVTVALAEYEYLFGTGEVVVEIAGKNLVRTFYDPSKRMDMWWVSSIGNAINVSILTAALFGFGYLMLLKRRNKHGD